MTTTCGRRRLRALLAALLAAALCLVSLTTVGPAAADDLDDKRRAAEEKQRRTEKELEELAHELEEISEDLAEAVRQLTRIQKKLPEAQAALAVAQEAYEKARREVKALGDRLEAQETTEAGLVTRIEEDEARSKEVRRSVGALARQALKGELSTSSLAIMLDAADPQEYVQQYGLVTAAMRSQTQLLEQLAQDDAANRNAKVRLEAVRQRIAELRADAIEKQKEADARQKEAAAHEAEVRQLIADQQAKTQYIESQKASIEEKQAQLQRDKDALEADIKELIKKQRERDEKRRQQERERQKQKQKENDKGKGGNDRPSGPVGSGLFRNPSSYEPMYITSRFGWRTHPVLGYRLFHSGLDLRAYCGMKILAGRGGEVVWAKYRSGYGNQVLVDHGEVNGNSVMSSYNHMQGFAVSPGQKVSAGDVVGYSGNTGTSTACHLHFEVYINGETVDPLPYL